MWNSFNIIFLSIIVYLCIFVLKIFGFYDYTAKYDIQYLSAAKQENEVSFILDNDLKTSWGYAFFEKAESVIAKFRKIKKIKEIIITNKDYKHEVFYLPKINIYSAYDLNNWKLCNYKLTQINEKHHYIFDSLCEGNFLKLEYANDDTGHWVISEIEIIE